MIFRHARILLHRRIIIARFCAANATLAVYAHAAFPSNSSLFPMAQSNREASFARLVIMVKYAAVIYDLSRPISDGMTVWPGDPPVTVTRASEPHEPAVSRLSLGSHVGTHVDPPAHFFPGAATADQLPLDALIGPAWLADVEGGRELTAQDLDAARIPDGVTRLLLRTVNSRTPADVFDTRFVGLAAGAAAWVLNRDLRLIGIDGPSIEPFDAPGEPVHRALLGAGVVIIEGLALRHAPGGACELICLPLLLAGGDGAPARVVIIA
jgi:arylformamidase